MINTKKKHSYAQMFCQKHISFDAHTQIYNFMKTDAQIYLLAHTNTYEEEQGQLEFSMRIPGCPLSPKEPLASLVHPAFINRLQTLCLNLKNTRTVLTLTENEQKNFF